MDGLVAAGAAVWGAGAGALWVPRVAFRLSAPTGEDGDGQVVEPGPYAECPDGHAFRPGWRGWLGPGCCRAGRVRPVWATALATAAVAALIAAFAPLGPELGVWLLLAPVVVALAVVDLAALRLPDRLTYPAAAGTAVLLGVCALLPHHHGSWLRALLAAAALMAFFFLLLLLPRSELGLGDVKLGATLGLALGWYGWRTLFGGVVAGMFAGALIAVVLLALRRVSWKGSMPYGPPLLAGLVLGLALLH